LGLLLFKVQPEFIAINLVLHFNSLHIFISAGMRNYKLALILALQNNLPSDKNTFYEN